MVISRALELNKDYGLMVVVMIIKVHFEHYFNFSKMEFTSMILDLDFKKVMALWDSIGKHYYSQVLSQFFQK